jgi:glycine/D-amino acid oxidase-like deaminating enzyme
VTRGEQAAGSVWAAESEPARPRPPLRGRAVADVAIVGGGFTGVSTAWHLRRVAPGLGIALLEARQLGHGASGRNGGQVLNGINGVTPETAEAARRIHAATSAGIDLAEELSARFAPPDTFRRSGCLEIYTHPRRAEAAAGRAAELRAAGVPVQFVPGSALGVQGAHGALLDPRAGRLNGFALLQALRPALVDDGISVYEEAPVRRVRAGAEIALETPEGELRARALVLATNAYTPALGFSSRTPGGRLLFGGGGNPAYAYRFGGSTTAAAGGGDRAARFLRSAMTRYFPALADAPIAHRWSGTLAITLDRVCSMGVGGDHRNVYHALGYSGHGVALALLAGRVLADLYQGNHEAWRDLPFYQKRLLPLPPEPLRWLGYQAYTKLTGRSPRRRRRV